jgi:3-methyladenine DNA glycosylase AlkD
VDRSSRASEIAALIVAECDALPIRNTANLRLIRCKYSRMLKPADSEFMLQLALCLRDSGRYRWFGYELLRTHKTAFKLLGATELERQGQGIDSWWTVDAFARTLSGPAWLAGLVSDELMLKWAKSPDRWWRRAALVSTVALNVRSQGGRGDVRRTLEVCRVLAADPDDMVVKALSWALRELVVHDPQAVWAFLDEYETVLAGRVKREVGNKLRTGLKNPNRKDEGGAYAG